MRSRSASVKAMAITATVSGFEDLEACPLREAWDHLIQPLVAGPNSVADLEDGLAVGPKPADCTTSVSATTQYCGAC